MKAENRCLFLHISHSLPHRVTKNLYQDNIYPYFNFNSYNGKLVPTSVGI